MTKAETLEIIKQVRALFGNKFKVDDPQGTLDAWHRVLADYEFEAIMANLTTYIKTNVFAPSVADLLAIEPSKDRAVPNPDETVAMLARWEQERAPLADAELVEAEKAKMRQILGIGRG